MLDNYFSILEGKSKAKYTLTKAISIENQDYMNMPLAKAWAVHDQILKSKEKITEKSSSEESLFDLKIILARRILEKCSYCERRCEENRVNGDLGVCGVGYQSKYSSDMLHMGEEIELVPSHTIFFSGCTFKCCYCQNWDIAMYPDAGRVVEPNKMVESIKHMKNHGSKNVNFVGGNPDPHLYTILLILKKLDLNIPIVWNSNMYASSETMKILDGLVDIYLADFRYGNDGCAKRYSKINNYMEILTRNFCEADRQTEIMLRHLVIPGHLECCTEPIMKWVSENIPDVYFNLMFQYRPCYQASEYPEINRILSLKEREEAVRLAEKYQVKFR